MEHFNKDISSNPSINSSDRLTTNIELKKFIDENNVPIKEEPPYLTVGERKHEKGWIIEFTTVISHIDKVIPSIISYLLMNNLCFQMPTSEENYQKILFGHFGPELQNKLILIYPTSENEAIEIVKNLTSLTTSNRFPLIRGSFHLLQGIHVRYDYTDCASFNGEDGRKKRYARLKNGNLVLNPLTNPYRHTKKVRWIWNEYKQYNYLKNSMVIGKKTVGIEILREDAKGRVLKGIFFKKWYLPTTCVIKTGRRNEILNSSGLDAADNITWQYHVLNILKKYNITSSPLDLVHDEMETSLVVEKIHGMSLASFVFRLHTMDGWKSISTTKKLIILDIALQIINIIKLIHDNNIIHRDINPSNFLISNQKAVKIIDFGMSYKVNPDKLGPIYIGITPGYTDPQRSLHLGYVPDIAEDIYSIGTLLIFLFTGINPALLDLEQEDNLRIQLQKLINDSDVVCIIAECVSNNKMERPQPEQIIKNINTYKTELIDSPSLNATKQPIFQDIIARGMRAINSSLYSNSLKLWLSSTADESRELQYDERQSIITNLYSGISGIIIAQFYVSSILGADKMMSNDAFLRENIEYLLRVYIDSKDLQPGLMTGTYGIGMALAQSIKNNKLNASNEIRKVTENILLTPVRELNLWSGLAGKGIFLLKSFNELNITEYKSQLQDINNILKDTQKSDGSWIFEAASSKSNECIATGNAGIVLYLLMHRKDMQSSSMDIHIHRCLKNIMKMKSDKCDNSYLFGKTGIAYVLLQAYDAFKKDEYRNFAKTILNSVDINNMREIFGIATGICGVGHVYLDAFYILNDDSYYYKALLIANYLEILKIEKPEELTYWHNNVSRSKTPDMFHGNSGIITFLARLSSTRSQHPVFEIM
ncbi:lanthionine synthetase LanC family protein [Chitinophaga sp. sic0106]|uniref:protein kinase domain-containing protein n=1 Tax=Chitinophaga sp. sic0106 TaxID=2854785 RepID=UPI001C43FAE3|nr:lanthionine synthetase LanC family protein [Chitinophaga sp. sic0106]MBV7531386.1 protein kinase [Chitinophaga sp. sic0106]